MVGNVAFQAPSALAFAIAWIVVFLQFCLPGLGQVVEFDATSRSRSFVDSGDGSSVRVYVDDDIARYLEGDDPPYFEIYPTTLLQPIPASPIPAGGFARFRPVRATATAGLPPGGLPPDFLSSRRATLSFSPRAVVIPARNSRVGIPKDMGKSITDSNAALGVAPEPRAETVTATATTTGRDEGKTAGNSFWIPARQDLDTALSKIDAQNVQDVVIIKGPYSSRHGPGRQFTDVALIPSPRFENGFSSAGSSSYHYESNGEQWSARQALSVGAQDWGALYSYDHRGGVDYLAGNGTATPGSYHTRESFFTLGKDLASDRSIEFYYLRLDQTDVEFPGYAFDIDFLVTDAFDVTYQVEDQCNFDRWESSAWYNRTRFEGNAQSPAKRRQFPLYDTLDYEGFTDVDSMSSGAKTEMTWGQDGCSQFAIGADLRFIKQELNEISDTLLPPLFFPRVFGINSPVPKSTMTDPGVFAEWVGPLDELLWVKVGARVDFINVDVIDDPAKLASLGPNRVPLSDILGTSDFHRNMTPWLAYLSAQYELNETWKLLVGVAHSRRPPTLTELYAAGTFMFVLQNGLNSVTGDPRLALEKSWHFDLGLICELERLRAGVSGFHTLLQDYITYVTTSVVAGEQFNLRYVNTDLATLSGFEAFVTYDARSWATAFATLSYVEGADHTRVSPVVPAPGVEPLPAIPPLEGRVGIRLHNEADDVWWIEFSGRLVADQQRVASSLGETPTSGFVTGDIHGSWQATDSLLVTSGVTNFTDTLYREHLSFRSPTTGSPVFQPGISFYVGSELSY